MYEEENRIDCNRADYGVVGVRNYGNVAGRSRGRGRGDRCDSQRDAGQSKLRKQESLKYRNIGQF